LFYSFLTRKYIYIHDSQDFDNESYFPEEGEDHQDVVEMEDPVFIANKPEHNKDVSEMTEEKEDKFMERLPQKQIEGLYNTLNP